MRHLHPQEIQNISGGFEFFTYFSEGVGAFFSGAVSYATYAFMAKEERYSSTAAAFSGFSNTAGYIAETMVIQAIQSLNDRCRALDDSLTELT